MKKLVLLLAPVITFSLTGCNKEILFPDGDEDIYGQGGSSSGVTKPTTITVEQDEEDLIAGTSFTRTISITFSDNGGGLVVSGASQPSLKSGVSVTGGTDYFNGMAKQEASISGGSDVSLSTYSSSNSGPGGWGPGW